MCRDKIGLDAQSFAKAGHRFRQFFLLGQGDTEVVVGLGIEWRHLDNASKNLFRFRELALSQASLTEKAPGFNVAVVSTKRLPVKRFRLDDVAGLVMQSGTSECLGGSGHGSTLNARGLAPDK